MAIPDYYAALGVAKTATSDQIIAAFRAKAQLLGGDQGNPEVEKARQVSALRQMMFILTDPDKRRKYDESLASGRKQEAEEWIQVWQVVGKKFFERAPRYTPAVDALRISIPLTLEGDNLLIVGIDPLQPNAIRHLNTEESRNLVRRILTELVGRPMDFRLISGVRLQDWLEIKQTEEIARQKHATSGQAAPADVGTAVAGAPIEEDWRGVAESLRRRLGPAPPYPQARARMVRDILPVIVRLEERSRAFGIAEDAIQRAVGQTLEHVAEVADLPALLLGWEYLRARDPHSGGIL